LLLQWLGFGPLAARPCSGPPGDRTREVAMTVLWWHWLVLGMVLVGLEATALGGVYVVFFGVSAVLLSLLSVLGIAGPLWFQLTFFAAFALLLVFVVRKPLLRWLRLDRAPPDVDSLVGELAVPLDPIEAGAVGRAELRGAVWTARTGSRPVGKGQRCRVTRVEHLVIVIEPEGAV
jgi:membrane protein implicated in regulation of membrane protease activity